ncbi:Transglutaminaselike, partial [Caligus rogercresseyi]
PNAADGTEITLPVDFRRQQLATDKTKWDISQHRTAPKILVLNVQIGSGLRLGLGRLRLRSLLPTIKSAHAESSLERLRYMFCSIPIVKSVSKLDEYVQNPTGKIWKGDVNNISSRLWIYAQFEEVVLPAICYIMDTKARISDADRGDPIKVSRAISSWNEPYENGTSPFEWNSSAPIFDEYLGNNGEVRYGQSWVFSALTVT